MSKSEDFVEKVRTHIDELGAELSTLEVKLHDAGEKADAWTSDQASKLKKDWENAKAEMTSIADRIENEGEEAVDDAKAAAERHWEALQAAVKTYRDHLEKNVAG